MSIHTTATPSIDNHSIPVAPLTSWVAGKAKMDPNHQKWNPTSNAKTLHHLTADQTCLLHLEKETADPSKPKARSARWQVHNSDANRSEALWLWPNTWELPLPFVTIPAQTGVLWLEVGRLMAGREHGQNSWFFLGLGDAFNRGG